MIAAVSPFLRPKYNFQRVQRRDRCKKLDGLDDALWSQGELHQALDQMFPGRREARAQRTDTNSNPADEKRALTFGHRPSRYRERPSTTGSSKPSCTAAARANPLDQENDVTRFLLKSDINGPPERPIKTQTKWDWLPIAAVLSPALIFAIPLAITGTHSAVLEFARNNWGNIASVWGLVVSVYVLFVAKGARKAAQDAVSAEKLRTALAGLEDAAKKNNDVGQFARVQKWDVVELRALEVLACCRATLAVWGDNKALIDSRRNLNDVANQMLSIVEESRANNPTRKTILDAQLRSHQKLAVVVGRIQKEHHSGSL